MLDLERGRVAFDKDQIGVGLLWTVESLRMATAAGDEPGRHLALANLAAWRRELVEPKALFSHGDRVLSVAFSPDGKTILAGSFDGKAQLWNVATCRPIGPPMVHSGVVNAVAFSPDGQTLLTGSRDKTARRWDAATGRPLGQPLVHSAPVFAVAFSPDGQTLLTGCSDKTARLWDAATGQPIGPPLPHSSDLWIAVAFSPDGRSLLTCESGVARRWDAPAPLPEDVPRLAAWIEAATGGWSWTIAARSGCSTRPQAGASAAAGAARRPAPGRSGAAAGPDPLRQRAGGAGRRLEGTGRMGPRRGRLRRGPPRPSVQPIGLGRPGPPAHRARPSRPDRGDAR
jgi:WD40 repeat protein